MIVGQGQGQTARSSSEHRSCRVDAMKCNISLGSHLGGSQLVSIQLLVHDSQKGSRSHPRRVLFRVFQRSFYQKCSLSELKWHARDILGRDLARFVTHVGAST